jgi:tripartite-type tricarboxylate transporter receptor subunit TctC
MMRASHAAALGTAMIMLSALAQPVAAQADYPNKPIRFITPYAPGGSTSVLARVVGQKMTERWGQAVVVDNRPGASTMIGTEALARAAPDGYTILLVSVDAVLIPQLLTAPYDILKDFAPVGTISATTFILLLHPAVPVNTLKEFVALGKSRPGQINYASAGSGTISHLVGEFLGVVTGMRMQHVPYKGGGPALTDLLGGHVQMLMVPPVTAIAHVQAGKLKGLAVSGETRLSALPQVPTFAEAGLPGFDARQWYGILAPARTPKAVIDKLSAELGRTLAMPDIRERLDGQGMDPFPTSPEQFAALLRSEMAKYGKVIKAGNIKVEM